MQSNLHDNSGIVMLYLRVINIIFYFIALFFMGNTFIYDNFFQQLGGAEYAFLLLTTMVLMWALYISYGLISNKSWGYSHALWLNSVAIFVLLARLVMTSQGVETSLSMLIQKDRYSLFALVFLSFTCFMYLKNSK